MNEKKRLVFIDCIRGLCILMVVYHHFLVMGMRDTGYESSAGKFMYMFFLPLFFFISGFVSLREKYLWTFKGGLQFVVNKTRGIFIPTLVMFFFSMFFYRLDVFDWVCVSFKSGYWFTWVLFQFFVVWCVLNVFVDFIGKRKDIGMTIIFLFLCGIVFNLIHVHFHESNKIVGFLSLNLFMKYLVYFALGLLVKHYFVVVKWMLSKKILNAFLFIISVIPIWMDVPVKIEMFVVFAQILCIFNVFFHKQVFFEERNFPSVFLANFGRNSLAIYFLHYYFLFKIPFISSWLQQFQIDYCFRGHSCGVLLEVIILSFLSIVVSACCVLVKKFLDMFPIISELCFGPHR